MKIELEFTKPGPGATGLDFVLRMCRKIPTFKEIVEGKMTIYRLEFTEKTLNSFVAIMDRLGWWKNISLCVDGNLVSREECWTRVYDFRRERRRGLKRVSSLCIDALNEAGGLRSLADDDN